MRWGKGCWDIVIDREKRSLLRRTGKTVVDIIAADCVVAIADGDDVDTISWGKGYIPVILGHSSDDVIMREMPIRTYIGVLYPYICIFGSNG